MEQAGSVEVRVTVDEEEADKSTGESAMQRQCLESVEQRRHVGSVQGASQR